MMGIIGRREESRWRGNYRVEGRGFWEAGLIGWQESNQEGENYRAGGEGFGGGSNRINGRGMYNRSPHLIAKH